MAGQILEESRGALGAPQRIAKRDGVLRRVVARVVRAEETDVSRESGKRSPGVRRRSLPTPRWARLPSPMRSPGRASSRRAGARANRELHQATGNAGCKPSPGAPAPPSSGRGLRRRGERATGRPRAWRAPRRPLSSGPSPRAGARPRKHRKNVWRDGAPDPGSIPIGERHTPSTKTPPAVLPGPDRGARSGHRRPRATAGSSLHRSAESGTRRFRSAPRSADGPENAIGNG